MQISQTEFDLMLERSTMSCKMQNLLQKISSQISFKKAVKESVTPAFPFMTWLPKYSKSKFKSDFMAGLVVAVILIPQVMAYAMLAGLPPVYGLYAALFGSAVGSLWGSSPQLATGPVAIVSFLTLTALTPLATPGSAEFIALAVVLALMVGLIQFLMGVFKFSFIMRAIPHSVLIGFSSAAAIIIASTQIPSLFGFTIGRHEFVFQTFIDLALSMSDTHILTMLIGASSLLLILLLKRHRPAFPAALLVLSIGTAVSYFFNLEGMGVAVVGMVPSDIPTPSLPAMSFNEFTILIGKAFVISLIGFMEAYAIAKAIASKTKKKLDLNQELVGQGLANIASSLFKGYPISGSFSRSAVNFSAGAQTAMSGVFVSLFVLITLLFLTPLLYHLPKAILAAIVIGAVVQLINTHKFFGTFKVVRTDGGIAFITFIFAFILKPDDAVMIGVVLALILFLHRVVRVRVRELGIDTKWDTLRSLDSKSAKVETFKKVVIARIEMSLFYANTDYALGKLRKIVERKSSTDGGLKMVILNFSGVNYMDMTGLEALEEYTHELEARGVDVYVMYVHRVTYHVMKRADAFSHIHEIHNIDELKEKVAQNTKNSV